MTFMALFALIFIAGCKEDDEVTPKKDGEAATVVSVSPNDEATGVQRSQTIEVNFDAAMDPATITIATFTVFDGTTPVLGTVSYADMKAVFTPTNGLKANTTYTANVSVGVKSAEGIAMLENTTWNFVTATATTINNVDLGASANYVILAKTAINNSSASTAITGDLALSPAATSYITGLNLTDATGYATSPQVTGSVYAADMADPTPATLTTAVENMITAYNDAAGRTSPDFVELGSGNIGGKTLSPGIYKWSNTVTMPTDVTISGGADDVWIFQIAGDLTVSSAVNIILANGAQAKNIYWQVAGEATLGTTSHFEGNILSMTGITLLTGASIHGRALAQTAVILDDNAVTTP